MSTLAVISVNIGASGYVLKDAPAARLAEAIRRVNAGGRAIDPELAAEAWGEGDPLTDRERQVLRLAADGRSGPEIAGSCSSQRAGAKLPVGRDQQGRRPQPRGCGANCTAKGVALTDPLY